MPSCFVKLFGLAAGLKLFSFVAHMTAKFECERFHIMTGPNTLVSQNCSLIGGFQLASVGIKMPINFTPTNSGR